ncbi:MAG: TPM domain-containing protein [Thermoanaerobaculia bacterium]
MSRFGHFESDRIVAAIAAAEKSTSGEIRVHVTRRVPDDLEARAKRRFHLLGMTNTKHRNGVLIYVAPRARKFRVLGDTGIHEKMGDTFWSAVAAEMEERFRKGEFTEGVIAAVQRVGEALATHFPPRPNDVNELPDPIDRE